MTFLWVSKAVAKAGGLINLNSKKLRSVVTVTLRGMATDSTAAGPAPGTAAGQGRHQKMGKQKQKQNLRHLNYIARRGGESKLSPPGLLDLLVVGTGASGTPRSAFLDMTYFRYLFNCGEGTQRVAMEHKMRLSKLKNIFITHKNWENMGGLLGMGLSLGGIGLPEITIHGPPNVEKMLTMSKGFSPLSLKVDKREISEGPYEDSAMKIEFIPIYPKENNSEDGEPAHKKRRPSDDDISVVYYCQPIPKARSLDLNKAVDLGVPRGPALGRLKSGETITLENGTKVTPDEVLSNPENMTPFLVLEVPTEDYLDSFLTNPTLEEVRSKGPEEAPQLVLHFTPPEVLNLPQYQQWMQGFDPATKHLVLNRDGSVVSHVAPYEIQARLNLIHPEIFPLLPHQSSELEKLPDIRNDQRTVPGRTGLKFSLREGGQTPRGYNSESCAEVNNELYLLELAKNEEFQEALAATKERLNAIDDKAGGDYPEVLFLGTGSAMPNKIRNVSAILLHTSADQCILLDSGEGTYGQLCHHYGNQTPAVLRRLNAIFLSHLHADHHMGLIGVVHGRERAFTEIGEEAPPLTVIVTWNYNKFIQGTDPDILPLANKINLVPIEWFVKPEEIVEKKSACDKVVKDLGLTEMKFARMRHPQFPYGLAIKHQAGWKLAYSGDTMPCDHFVDIGEDCDLLIHEATMEDELVQEALEKKHSTTSQAIEVGMKMRAKFILLTHFSQRYAKVPRISPNFTDKVGIAFDNMKVRPRDLPLLPLLLPALQALFSEDLQDLEKRTEKRRLNKETKRLMQQLEGQNKGRESTVEGQNRGNESKLEGQNRGKESLLEQLEGHEKSKEST